MGVMIAPVVGSGSCPAWMQMVEKRALSSSFTQMTLSPCNADPEAEAVNGKPGFSLCYHR